MRSNSRKALLGLFLVILFDVSSFGMVIPLTPILAREFGANSLELGLLISCYSLIQFLFAPFWGRLSDLLGRKPIILCGLAGSSAAHLLFAFSDNFEGIFFSRALAGFFGANMAVATAYIADLTSPEKRSKNLGLIGMAFGMGFTLGPIMGFCFIFVGEGLGTMPPFGANFASVGAGFFCLMNFLASLLFLKESLPSKLQVHTRDRRQGAYRRGDHRPGDHRQGIEQGIKQGRLSVWLSAFKKSRLFARPSPYMIWIALKNPKLGPALWMSFLLWLALAYVEPVLTYLVQDEFGWDKKTAYSSFIYIGLLMVLSQGLLVRIWIPKWGERRVNQKGLLAAALGLSGIALAGLLSQPSDEFFSSAFFVLFAGVSFFSIGYSLSNTSLNGALSLLSPPKKQGSIFGVNQSLSAFARILGPAISGWLYQDFSRQSPFWAGALLLFMGLMIAFFRKKAVPETGKTQALPTPPESTESDLYSLNRFQLKNLRQKNIPFLFFQLEDFSLPLDPETQELMDRAERVELEGQTEDWTENQVKSQVENRAENQIGDQAEQQTKPFLSDRLKNQSLDQAIVLICRTGKLSVREAEALREKNFINVYFVKEGIEGLLKEKN